MRGREAVLEPPGPSQPAARLSLTERLAAIQERHGGPAPEVPSPDRTTAPASDAEAVANLEAGFPEGTWDSDS